MGQRAWATEKRRGPARRSRVGSRPAKGLFGSFLVPQKGTRTRKRAKAVHLLCFPFVHRYRPVQIIREEQSFRAVRAAYFCLVKSKHDSADALANGEAGPKGECRRCESNRHRRTLADAMKPHRSPALLA